MTPIFGQDYALGVLQAALDSGRFHHAWIFAGPLGVGKFTTAMNLARVLLDAEHRNRPRALFAPLQLQTRVQQMIDQGTHPDLHIVRKDLALYSDDRELREKKQTNIPIDLLRERVIGGGVGSTVHDAPAYRTAAFGHGKAFIIDEADLLAREAQNTLLKTLEEPPANTWFFLVTSQPEELYATIHSRCQIVRFGRLDDAAMKAWARHAASQGSSAVDPWALEYAEGSPGVARLAMDYGFSQWQSRLDPMLAELDRGRFPAAMGATLGELAEEFAQAWVKAHRNASKDAANKDASRHLLTLLAAHARRVLHRHASAGSASAFALAEVIDLIAQTERQIDSNVNMKLALDNLVVQWNQAMQPAHVT